MKKIEYAIDKVLSLTGKFEKLMQRDRIQEGLIRILFIDFLFFVLYGGWVIGILFYSVWIEDKIDFFFWLFWFHLAIWGCYLLDKIEKKDSVTSKKGNNLEQTEEG